MLVEVSEVAQPTWKEINLVLLPDSSFLTACRDTQSKISPSFPSSYNNLCLMSKEGHAFLLPEKACLDCAGALDNKTMQGAGSVDLLPRMS